MRLAMKAIAALGAAILTISPAAAQYDVAPDSGDTAWLLTAALVSLFAVLPGLALFLGSRLPSRARPALTASSLAVLTSVTLFWAILGYSLAYGAGSDWLGGFGNLFLGGMADIRAGTTIPESAYALFQLGFALFAAMLLAGAAGGRAHAGWLIVFTLLWILLVHVPIARWLWGSGWLSQLGALDHSGGLVVQASAGVSALVVAWMLGAPGETKDAAPLDPLIALIGAAVLLVGWLGVTGGSSLAAGDDAARAMMNTLLSASTAALAWFALERMRHGTVSAIGPAIGAVAGLAAITPAAGYAGAGGAILTGLVVGVACPAIAGIVRQRLRIDDTLGIFAVHGVGGIIGALLLPIAMLPVLGAPVFEDATPFAQQLVAQIVAIGTVTLWSLLGTLIAGYMAAMILPMRSEVETA